MFLLQVYRPIAAAKPLLCHGTQSISLCSGKPIAADAIQSTVPSHMPRPLLSKKPVAASSSQPRFPIWSRDAVPHRCRLPKPSSPCSILPPSTLHFEAAPIRSLLKPVNPRAAITKLCRRRCYATATSPVSIAATPWPVLPAADAAPSTCSSHRRRSLS